MEGFDILWMQLVCMVVILTSPVNAGRILLFPFGSGYTSHLTDLLTMSQILHHHGHHVGFLVNSAVHKQIKPVHDIHFHVFPTSASQPVPKEDETRMALLMSVGDSPALQKKISSLADSMRRTLRTCEDQVTTQGLLAELVAEKYDLFIVDIVDNCGRVIAQFLNIPTMPYCSNGFFPDDSLFPNLPSFVPVLRSRFTSDMTFWERVHNTVVFIIMDFYLSPRFFTAFEQLQEKYNLSDSRNLAFRKAYTKSIFLVHADYVFEYPRPLLPNVVLIGGMFVPEAKPLEDDLEEFMAGSGKEGVILVSFGSMIKQITPEKASVMAKVLAKLPQRIIWRHDGPHPKEIGVNTRILRWLPQNDLLAHPQTRLFVTHCGIHGAYEALQHSVPVVAVPLMADQHMNAIKLVKRVNMGVLVEFLTLTEESFGIALNEVLDNPAYKDNARKASQLLRDHPETAQQRFLFWVDYVIRHKGIEKMILTPVTHMSPFQLYCVDVVMFLFAVITAFALVLVFIMRRVLHFILSHEIIARNVQCIVGVIKSTWRLVRHQHQN